MVLDLLWAAGYLLQDLGLDFEERVGMRQLPLLAGNCGQWEDGSQLAVGAFVVLVASKRSALLVHLTLEAQREALEEDVIYNRTPQS